MLRLAFIPFSLFLYIQSAIAQPNLESLEKNLRNAKDDTSRVLAMARIANYYSTTHPDSAAYFGRQAVYLSEKINYLYGKFSGYVPIFFAINFSGDYPKAMKRAMDNLMIAEQIKDRSGPFHSALQNIGLVNFEMGNYAEAKSYFYRSIRAQDSSEATDVKQGGAHMQLGALFLNTGNLDSALIFAKEGYEIEISHENGRNNTALGLYTAVLANIYEAMNKLDSARLLYFRAQRECRERNNLYILARVYHNIARLLSKSKEMDSSIYYAKRSLDICDKYHFAHYAMDASTLLMNVYQSRHIADSSLKYMRIMLAAKDTLFNQSSIQQVMQNDFDEKEHQREIAAAKAAYQNKLRLYGLLSVSLIFLLLLIFFYRSSRLRKKNNALLQKQKLNLEQALADLKATQAQLIQSEKMASLGEITAGIAHEIQNPLNFVKNFSEVTEEILAELEEHLDQPDSELDSKMSIQGARENLKKISHHGLRAAGIVKSMLQHSRSSSGKKEAVDIVKLVEEHFRISYNSFRARDNSFSITMDPDFDPDIPVMYLIPEDIGIVFLNVFQNALYSVSQKIRGLQHQRSVSNVEYLPAIFVSIKRMLSPEGGNRQVEICIKDNGLGISQMIMNKIFQPFFTTKPTGQGTGLGLSLCYDIITKEHGGTIRVETKEGEYAEFIIDLPVVDG